MRKKLFGLTVGVCVIAGAGSALAAADENWKDSDLTIRAALNAGFEVKHVSFKDLGRAFILQKGSRLLWCNDYLR
jgi:hypothetical protein